MAKKIPISNKWKIQNLLPSVISPRELRSGINLRKFSGRMKLGVTRVGRHELVLLADHSLCWASRKMSANLPPRWCGPFLKARFLTPGSVISVLLKIKILFYSSYLSIDGDPYIIILAEVYICYCFCFQRYAHMYLNTQRCTVDLWLFSVVYSLSCEKLYISIQRDGWGYIGRLRFLVEFFQLPLCTFLLWRGVWQKCWLYFEL